MIYRHNLKKYTDYFLDILLALSVLVTLVAGYIIWFVLPRGTGLHGFEKCMQEGYGYGNIDIALGFPRFIWVDIHNWAAVALLVIIILHVILHISWFIQTTKKIANRFVKSAWHLTEQYIASIVLMALFIFEGISGFILWVILPRGVLDYNPMLSDNGRTFWILQRDTWVDLHAWIAVIIVSIVIIHLIINRGWVVATSKNIFNGIQGLFQKKGDINVTNQS